MKDHTDLENSLIANWLEMFDHPESLAGAVFQTKVLFVVSSLQSVQKVMNDLKDTPIPTESLEEAFFENVSQLAGAVEEFKRDLPPEKMIALNKLLHRIRNRRFD